MAKSATASALRRALSDICEFCGKSLTGHRFAEFASAIGSLNEIPSDHPISGYGLRRWREVRSSQQFDGGKDATVVYAIECPNCISPNGQILDMVLIHDPFELYGTKVCIERISAVDDEAAVVYELVPAEAWQSFE